MPAVRVKWAALPWGGRANAQNRATVLLVILACFFLSKG